MGTRGACGFRVDGSDKVSYNHYDSYPSGLGTEIVKFICDRTDIQLKELAKSVVLVDSEVPPTDEQKKMCRDAGTLNIGVSTGSEDEWYCLLRDAQGSLESLEKLPLMEDSNSFLEDSLFCEYAYILNVDANKLEVYRGFNQKKNRAGRYAKLTSDNNFGYYGVVLVAVIPFKSVRKLGSGVLSDILETLCNESRGYDIDGKADKSLEKNFKIWRPTLASVDSLAALHKADIKAEKVAV